MTFGLYGAGAVSGSFLARLPRLADRLGPVASSSYPAASRMVNTLRAGYPVKNCAAFAACRVVLVAVPERAAAKSVAVLAAASLDWAPRIVLLCECGPGSRVLDPLRRRGAAAGSLSPIESAGARYVIEGDAAALRAARRLVRDLRARAIQLDAAAVPLYRAGVSFATALFTPLLAASGDTLRRAGVTPTTSSQIAGAMFQRTLRAWLHGGKKSWTGALPAGDCSGLRGELDALERDDKRTARLYREVAVFALEYFDRHPELRKQLRGTEP